jgi:hypothetical protein
MKTITTLYGQLLLSRAHSLQREMFFETSFHNTAAVTVTAEVIFFR